MSLTYIRNEACETTLLDDEWLILNTENLTITKLNTVGGFCWNLFKEPQTRESLTKNISHYYIGDIEQPEIDNFVDQLIEYGLIQNASK